MTSTFAGFADLPVGRRFFSKGSGSREYVKVCPYPMLGLDTKLIPVARIVNAWDHSGIHYFFEDDDIVEYVEWNS